MTPQSIETGENYAPENFENNNENEKKQGWGYRHQQSLILLFTLAIAYSMRACMGVALVAMTHQNIPNVKFTNSTNHTNINDIVSDHVNTVNKSVGNVEDYQLPGLLNTMMLTPPYPQFNWSKKVQDTVLSSFFWGYMAFQVPAGQLLHRFGVRYLITAAMLINCVIALFLPLGTYYGGWICVVILRIMQGLSQACVVPGIHTFFGKWATLEERGRLTSLTYGGQALGTVLGLPLTGFISSSAMGWPGIFRFYGLLSGAIAGVVWWMTADTPAAHPNISAAEKQYIEIGLGQKVGYEKAKFPVPWSKMLRHSGVYAIIVSHISCSWGQVILYSEVPAFMDKVMGVNIKANGLLTALPFMVMWLTNFFFSWLTDMLIVKKVMSVTNVRKFANSLGYVPAALGLAALAYVPKNIYVVETLLVIICAFKVSATVGFQVNHIDISPNFAGTLMSMSNSVSNAVASLAPIVAGFILTDVKSEYLWSQVFLIAGGLYFFTNLFYLIFGTAEEADWNDPDFGHTEDDKLEKRSLVVLKDGGHL